MKALKASATIAGLAASLLVTAPSPATAKAPTRLFGTTGACNNAVPGGPCTRTSR